MSETAPIENNQPSMQWRLRLLLMIWLLFLLVTILVGSPLGGDWRFSQVHREVVSYETQGEWRFSPVSEELDGYERILHFPPHNFPGYPFIALDAVRSLINPILHMTRWAFLVANAFFLFLLIGATYFSASQLGDETDGLVAALLISTIPFVMSNARVYDVHMPRLAAVALTLAALQHLAIKPKITNAVVLVSAFLLGAVFCSSSTDFIFYGLALAGPLAIVFLAGVWRQGNRWLFAVTGLVLLILIGILSPIWFCSAPFPGWVTGNERVFNDLGSVFADPRSVFQQPEALLAYLYVLVKAMLSFPLNLVFLVGFVVFCWRKDPKKWLWLVGVLAFFIAIVLLPKRNKYYVASLLPALTVAAAVGLGFALRRWRSWALPMLCALLVLLHVAYATLLIEPGKINSNWEHFFVPGNMQYPIFRDTLGLEPFGTRVLNEDEGAMRLVGVMADKPLPLAIGFFGVPCQQERTVIELVYRGVYARDLLCSPPVDSSAIALDAIVLMPNLIQVPGIAEAQSARDALARLQAAIDKDASLVTAFLISDPNKNEQAVEPLLRLLEKSIQQHGELLSQYCHREKRGNYLIFWKSPSQF